MFNMVKKKKSSVSPMRERARERETFCSSLGASYKKMRLVTPLLGVTGDLQDGDSSNGPGEAQADQHQRDRRCGECGRAEAGLQPAPALHAGQRQKRRDAAGLLFRARAHGA